MPTTTKFISIIVFSLCLLFSNQNTSLAKKIDSPALNQLIKIIYNAAKTMREQGTKIMSLEQKKPFIQKCTPPSFDTSHSTPPNESAIKTICSITVDIPKLSIVTLHGGGFGRLDKGSHPKRCFVFLKKNGETPGHYGINPIAWFQGKTPNNFSLTRFLTVNPGKHTFALMLKLTNNTTCGIGGTSLQVLIQPK